MAYRDIAKPGVRVVQETITAIAPEARRVTTDAGVHEAEFLVIALGADYDMDATPGLAEGGNEFYSVAAPSGSPGSSQPSPRGTRSSACAAHRSNALPRRANARCCCMTS